MPFFWSKPKAEPPAMHPIVCPNPSCREAECMYVRDAYRCVLVDGKPERVKVGECYVCLHCDSPFVTSSLQPTGVFSRRRVAAGVPVPYAPGRGEVRGPEAGLPATLAEMLKPLDEPV